MTTYHVELRRVSYVNLTVEAASLEEAEEKAWAELETGDYGKVSDAEWTIELLQEEGAAA